MKLTWYALVDESFNLLPGTALCSDHFDVENAKTAAATVLEAIGWRPVTDATCIICGRHDTAPSTGPNRRPS